MAVPSTSWSESSPAGSDLMSTVDNRIREMKTQVREVVGVDHDFPSSGQATDNGQHLRVTLQEQADLGSGAVGTTILGSQTINGKGELVYTDEDDNDIQITKDGFLHAPSLKGVYPAADLAAVASIMNYVYPVGSVYSNVTVSTNPGTLLGVGTWVAIEGYVIAGYKAGDANFGTAGATVGVASVTLTAAQSGVPAHTHNINGNDAAGAVMGLADAAWNGRASASGLGAVTQANSTASAAEAHTNIQPTLVAYSWRRTA